MRPKIQLWFFLKTWTKNLKDKIIYAISLCAFLFASLQNNLWVHVYHLNLIMEKKSGNIMSFEKNELCKSPQAVRRG